MDLNTKSNLHIISTTIHKSLLYNFDHLRDKEYWFVMNTEKIDLYSKLIVDNYNGLGCILCDLMECNRVITPILEEYLVFDIKDNNTIEIRFKDYTLTFSFSIDTKTGKILNSKTLKL